MELTKNTRKVQLNGDVINFDIVKEGEKQESIVLLSGPELLKSKFFSSEYPNDAEMERALNHIEYELTQHKELKNHDEVLALSNDLIADMLGAKEEQSFLKAEVDAVFSKYTDCAYGEPAPLLSIDYSIDKLSAIIVIRSIMFYLGFETLTIVK